MGYTSVWILSWVVNLSIYFSLSNTILFVCARCSGVITECLEFDTNFLTVLFLHSIFAFDLPSLMRLGAVSFTFIANIYLFISVPTTSESVIDPKIMSLSWKMSLGTPLLWLLDIYATHYLSPYGMFLSVVTFSGSYSTSPSFKTMWSQGSKLYSYGTYV